MSATTPRRNWEALAHEKSSQPRPRGLRQNVETRRNPRRPRGPTLPFHRAFVRVIDKRPNIGHSTDGRKPGAKSCHAVAVQGMTMRTSRRALWCSWLVSLQTRLGEPYLRGAVPVPNDHAHLPRRASTLEVGGLRSTRPRGRGCAYLPTPRRTCSGGRATRIPGTGLMGDTPP
jgi:hypothetical protein